VFNCIFLLEQSNNIFIIFHLVERSTKGHKIKRVTLIVPCTPVKLILYFATKFNLLQRIVGQIIELCLWDALQQLTLIRSTDTFTAVQNIIINSRV